jgi:uncharacterized protein YggE
VEREEQLGEARGPTVTVLGEAALRTEPDEAFVWITLSKVDDAPGPALEDVAKRSEALSALLDELGIAREARSTTGITVAEEFDHTSRGRRSLGHWAAASLSVRLTDLDLIGRVVMRASAELDARVAGPSWRVSPTNPAWLEVAARASANAQAKAAAYAAGVDARLGRLLALSEPELEPRYGRGMGHAFRAAAAVASGGGDVAVEAGEQEVAAAIQATFALDPA